ncbi:glycosyltransferase family 4 protein [Paraburkholderia flagellata]|uniref:glycosyltransferase family 4 protein n=1 Tax=Paraburkholderia flagellata TaxID=2883241 RepID=UPI001F2CBBF9|nr:glycosyltransferase family 4 protein [Paraburkholderia flagellata]
MSFRNLVNEASIDGKRTVCFFFQNFNGFGGAERSAISVANGLAEAGFDVTLLSLASIGSPFFAVDERVRMVSIFEEKTSFKKNYFLILHEIRKLLRKLKVDVWVDVDPIMCLFSTAALSFCNVKRVAWEHFNLTNDLGRRERRWGRWLAARYSDVVVVLTRQDQEMWITNLKPYATVEVVYNPCPFEGELVTAGDVKENMVLSVGRLVELKGYDLLIEAWKVTCGDNTRCAGWTLVIVGDGPEEGRLKSLSKQIGVADSVVFAGKQSDVARYYRSADIYCLSSRAEGLPMVLIEAQAYGLPIVAFDCLTGPAEIVSDGRDGILVKPGDIHGLAQAMSILIDDRNRRLNMSSASRTASSRFDRNEIIKQWRALCIRGSQ